MRRFALAITASLLLSPLGVLADDTSGVSSGIQPGQPWVDDGLTLTPGSDRDVDLRDATPHLTFRDTTDDTAYQFHVDSATATAPWQGLSLFRGTDAGNAFTVSPLTPLLNFNLSNQLTLPQLGGSGTQLLQVDNGGVLSSTGLSVTTTGWTDDGASVSLTTNTDNVSLGTDTAGGKLFIDGDTDEIQLQVQGFSTQTALPLVVEQSDGTDVFTVSNAGAAVSATLDTGQGANELYDMDQNVLTTSDVSFKDITSTGTNPNYTLQHTGGDAFGFHTEAGNVAYLNNETDGVHYLHFGSGHELDLGGGVSGALRVPFIRLSTDGTGNSEVQLPVDTIGVDELDTADSPANGEVLTFQSSTGRMVWSAGGGNSFETISVPAGTNPVADSSTDTLTITETSPLIITGTAGTDTINITWDTLTVAEGGTGATSLTDGGILLGSGTGAITPLGVAANGQIPIGDGTTDPVLATITQGTGITVTNGAGTITIASTVVNGCESVAFTRTGAAGAGDQTVTGVGFAGTDFFLTCTDDAADEGICWSMCDGDTDPECKGMRLDSATNWSMAGGDGSDDGCYIDDVSAGGSNYLKCNISAIGADGFTCTWTEAGTGPDVTCGAQVCR